MHPPRWPRHLAGLLGLAFLLTSVSALSWSGTARASVLSRDVVVRALADPSRLVDHDWRAALAPYMAAVPELHRSRSVGARLGGQVLAGTLNLPKTLDLTATP